MVAGLIYLSLNQPHHNVRSTCLWIVTFGLSAQYHK